MSISQSIQASLTGLGADALTDVFVFLLVTIFIASWVLTLLGRYRHYTAYTPTLLTTVGMLGTFVGIVAGLLVFDIAHIDASINGLLEGLKTAFITSLVGVFLSILYKVLVSLEVIAPLVKDEFRDLQLSDLYRVMRHQASGIDELTRIVADHSESGLIGQLKQARVELSDQHKAVHDLLLPSAEILRELNQHAIEQKYAFIAFEERLSVTLQEFAVMMSRSASEQMIVALKDVIHDFNNNLIEQFGENFRRLNDAVFNLVQWQETYRLQMIDMQQQYEQTITIMQKTEESVAHINDSTQSIPVAMQALSEVMQVNQHQIGELGRHLNAFQDVRDRAIEAVPAIRHQLDEAIDGMYQASQRVGDNMLDNSNKVQETHLALQQALQSFVGDFNRTMTDMISDVVSESNLVSESMRTLASSLLNASDVSRQEFEAGLESVHQQLSTHIRQLTEQQAQESQRLLAGMAQVSEQALAQTDAQLSAQLVAIDRQIEAEAERLSAALVRSLTQVTHRFVHEYQRSLKQNKLKQLTRQ